MSKVAMPSMRKFGYDDSLATGSIAAGGTLGILIPPSVILVIYAMLAEQNITLTVAPEAMDWLAAEGYNPEFGARPLKRVIKKRVLRQLSKQMLQNEIQPGSQIVLDVFGDVVVFRQAREGERVTETAELL